MRRQVVLRTRCRRRYPTADPQHVPKARSLERLLGMTCSGKLLTVAMGWLLLAGRQPSWAKIALATCILLTSNVLVALSLPDST